VEEVASHVVEAAYADWGDLDGDDIAAIEEGLADLEAGRVISHEEVMADVRKKYGW
jgi:predicted transcriptional regulator